MNKSYMAEYMLARYHDHISRGVCRHCEEPIHRSSMCERHYNDWAAKHKAKKAAYDKEWRRKQRAKALAAYGNTCARCDSPKGRLEFHHTNRNGPLDRATKNGKEGGAHSLNRRIARDGKQDGVELLCSSCHHAEHPK
jgi:DNA-directed RNA polymerase subunit M/transcription elongation factor TFIIS